MGVQWQQEENALWKLKNLFEKNDYLTFLARIDSINEDAIRKGETRRFNREEFEGSLGAWDATYSVRPRIEPSILAGNGEDPTADRLYSDYPKCHAYKLILFTSHGIRSKKKFIMWLGVGPGGAHDNPLLVGAQRLLKRKLLRKARNGLGDHAFHGCHGVIVPYTNMQMLGANAVGMGHFNHSHSSDRMTSEHGVMYMKLWGVIRGRCDVRLYEDETLYYAAVDVCWALHNYKSVDVPDFLSYTHHVVNLFTAEEVENDEY
jgi:hypothetical protein